MTSMAIVDGAPGAGKTTLIRRLLESNKSRVIQASRCRAKPGSGPWTEQMLPRRGSERRAEPDSDELFAYEDAGADCVSLLTYDTEAISGFTAAS